MEPPLLPLNGETIAPVSTIHNDEARADVCATGFWGKRQGAFFDIRIFHPNAPSYLKTQPASLFRMHELEKKQEYGNRVRSVSVLHLPLLFFLRLVDLVGK